MKRVRAPVVRQPRSGPVGAHGLRRRRRPRVSATSPTPAIARRAHGVLHASRAHSQYPRRRRWRLRRRRWSAPAVVDQRRRDEFQLTVHPGRVFLFRKLCTFVFKATGATLRSVFTARRSVFTASRSVFTASRLVFTANRSVFTASRLRVGPRRPLRPFRPERHARAQDEWYDKTACGRANSRPHVTAVTAIQLPTASWFSAGGEFCAAQETSSFSKR